MPLYIADPTKVALYAPADAKRVNVFVDEGSTAGCRFSGYAGLWVSADEENSFRERLASIRLSCGMKATGEFKWTKLSGTKPHPAYVQIIDAFFESPCAQFKALVVDNRNPGGNRGSDSQRDYYTWIHWLARRRCEPGFVYRLFIDRRTGRQGSQLAELKTILNNSARKDGVATYDCFRDVIAVDSANDSLIQLADVLLGAVCYHFNNRHIGPCSASKRAVARYIATKAGFRMGVIRRTWREEPKFNVWLWNPSTPTPRKNRPIG
jgi:hypothetical protein